MTDVNTKALLRLHSYAKLATQCLEMGGPKTVAVPSEDLAKGMDEATRVTAAFTAKLRRVKDIMREWETGATSSAAALSEIRRALDDGR